MASDNPLSALSSGLVVERLLRDIGLPVIPVYGALPDVAPDGPAVSYRRVATETVYTKGAPPESTASVEVWIYDPSYAGSVSVAETVRASVEGRSGRVGSLRLSRATLANALEDFAGDKYIQVLTFNLTITPIAE